MSRLIHNQRAAETLIAVACKYKNGHLFCFTTRETRAKKEFSKIQLLKGVKGGGPGS